MLGDVGHIQKEQKMVVGVIGAGPSQRKATNALLDDWNEAHGPLKFVLPGTVPEFTDGVRHVADWAITHDAETVWLIDGHNQADLDDYGTDLVVTEVGDIREVLGEFVDTLFVVWHDDDEPFVEATLGRGVPCYDLSAGLAPLSVDDSPAEVPAPRAQKPVDDVVEHAEVVAADEAQATVTGSRTPSPPQEPVDTSDWLAGPKVRGEFLDLVIHDLRESSFVDDIADAVIAKIRERL